MRLTRLVSLLLSVVYFTTQVALGSVAESNIWADRRRGQSQARENSDPTLLASLPAANPMWEKMPVAGVPTLASSWSKKKTLALPLWADSFLQSLSQSHVMVQDVIDSGNRKAPMVILLQDVHMNLEAQKNMAAALGGLIEAKKLGAIGVEGAFDVLNFQVFRKHQRPDLAKLVMDDFLKKNLISAPSYAAITSAAAPPVVVGVDDKRHYELNVNAVLEAKSLKEPLLKKIDQEEKILQAQKETVLNPRLRRFEQLKTAHAKGLLGMGNYVAHLASYPEATIGLALEQFIEAVKMEKAMDFARVERERKVVLEKLTQKLSRDELSVLMRQSIAYKSGQMSFGDYYQGLKDLCIHHGISLQSAPAFDNYIHYVLLSDGIKANQLFESVRELEKSLTDKLAQSPEEKALMNKAHQMVLARKLVEFSLTPEEWSEYTRSSRILDLSEGEAQKSDLIPFEAFYKEADIRSKVMVDKLLAQGKTGIPSLLVVGGFHTPLITEVLKEKKASVIVLSPKITEIEEASGTAYLSVFSREKTPLDRLFSGEKLFLAPSSTLAIGQPGSEEQVLPAGILNLEAAVHAGQREVQAEVESGDAVFSLTHSESDQNLSDSAQRFGHVEVQKKKSVLSWMKRLITSWWKRDRGLLAAQYERIPGFLIAEILGHFEKVDDRELAHVAAARVLLNNLRPEYTISLDYDQMHSLGYSLIEMIKNALPYVDRLEVGNGFPYDLDQVFMGVRTNPKNKNIEIVVRTPTNLVPGDFSLDQLKELLPLLEHLNFLVNGGLSFQKESPHPSLASYTLVPGTMNMVPGLRMDLPLSISIVKQKIDKLEKNLELDLQDVKDLIFGMYITTKIESFKNLFFNWEGKESTHSKWEGGRGYGMAYSKIQLNLYDLDMNVRGEDDVTEFVVEIPKKFVKHELGQATQSFRQALADISAVLNSKSHVLLLIIMGAFSVFIPNVLSVLIPVTVVLLIAVIVIPRFLRRLFYWQREATAKQFGMDFYDSFLLWLPFNQHSMHAGISWQFENGGKLSLDSLSMETSRDVEKLAGFVVQQAASYPEIPTAIRIAARNSALRYLMGEQDLDKTMDETMTQLHLALGATVSLEDIERMRAPFRVLFSKYGENYRSRYFSPQRASIRSELKNTEFSGMRWENLTLAEMNYFIVQSDSVRVFLSPGFWFILGSLVGGVTTGAVFLFLMRFIFRPFYEGLLVNMENRARQEGRPLSYAPFAFGQAWIGDNAGWSDIRRSYYELESLSVDDEAITDIERMKLFELVVERDPLKRDLLELAIDIRERLMQLAPESTRRERWEIISTSVRARKLSMMNPGVLFILSILKLPVLRPPHVQLSVDEIRSSLVRHGERWTLIQLAFLLLRIPLFVARVIFLLFVISIESVLIFLNLKNSRALVFQWDNWMAVQLGMVPIFPRAEKVKKRNKTQAEPFSLPPLYLEPGKVAEVPTDQERKELLIAYIEKMNIKDIGPLLDYVRSDVKIKFHSFVDSSWYPTQLRWFNLRKFRGVLPGQYSFDLENNTLVLSSEMPAYINTLVLLKLVPLAFRHEVLRGEKQNIHLPHHEAARFQSEFYKILFKDLWSNGADHFQENGANPQASGERSLISRADDYIKNLIYLIFIMTHALWGHVYSRPNEPGILYSWRPPSVISALIKTKENFIISAYLLLARRFLGQTNQPEYHAGVAARSSEWGIAWGLARPILTHLSSAAAYFLIFLSIFGGLILNLDLEFLLNWLVIIKDWLAMIDFLDIGPWIEYAWNHLVDWYRIAASLVELAGIKEFFVSIWASLQPVRSFVVNYAIPFFYYFALPGFLYFWGMMYGYLIYKARLGSYLAENSVEMAVMATLKVIGIVPGMLDVIFQEFIGGSDLYGMTERALRKFYGFLRYPLVTLAWAFYLFVHVVGMISFVLILGLISYPPFDLTSFFGLVHSFGIPLTPFVYVTMTAIVIGFPFSLYYWMFEKVSKWFKVTRPQSLKKMFLAGALGVMTLTVFLPISSKYQLSRNPFNSRDIIEHNILMNVEKWNDVEKFTDLPGLIDRELVRDRLFGRRFAGWEGAVDPNSGKHDLYIVQDEWVRDNKERIFRELENENPAVYGNPMFFQSIYMDDPGLISSMFSDDQKNAVFNHMLKILEEPFSYDTFAATYRNQYTALWVIEYLLNTEEVVREEGLQRFLEMKPRTLHDIEILIDDKKAEMSDKYDAPLGSILSHFSKKWWIVVPLTAVWETIAFQFAGQQMGGVWGILLATVIFSIVHFIIKWLVIAYKSGWFKKIFQRAPSRQIRVEKVDPASILSNPTFMNEFAEFIAQSDKNLNLDLMMRSKVQEWITNRSRIYVSYDLEGRLSGYLTAVGTKIDQISTRQKNGFGTALMDVAIKDLIRDGATSVSWWAMGSSPLFYHRFLSKRADYVARQVDVAVEFEVDLTTYGKLPVLQRLAQRGYLQKVIAREREVNRMLGPPNRSFVMASRWESPLPFQISSDGHWSGWESVEAFSSAEPETIQSYVLGKLVFHRETELIQSGSNDVLLGASPIGDKARANQLIKDELIYLAALVILGIVFSIPIFGLELLGNKFGIEYGAYIGLVTAMAIHGRYNHRNLAGRLPYKWRKWFPLASVATAGLANGDESKSIRIPSGMIRRILENGDSGFYAMAGIPMKEHLRDVYGLVLNDEETSSVGYALYEVLKNTLQYVQRLPGTREGIPFNLEMVDLSTRFNPSTNKYEISTITHFPLHPKKFSLEKLTGLKAMIEHLQYLYSGDPRLGQTPPHPSLAHLKLSTNALELSSSRRSNLSITIKMIEEKIAKIKNQIPFEDKDYDDLIFGDLVTTNLLQFEQAYFVSEGKARSIERYESGGGIGMTVSRERLRSVGFDLELRPDDDDVTFSIVIPSKRPSRTAGNTGFNSSQVSRVVMDLGDVKVRRLTVKDFDQMQPLLMELSRIEIEVFTREQVTSDDPLVQEKLERWKEHLKDNRYEIFILVDKNNDPIGLGEILKDSDGKGSGELQSFCVDPRRTDIDNKGTRLLNVIFSWCRAHGIKKVSWNADGDSPFFYHPYLADRFVYDAWRNYVSFGFEVDLGTYQRTEQVSESQFKFVKDMNRRLAEVQRAIEALAPGVYQLYTGTAFQSRIEVAANGEKTFVDSRASMLIWSNEYTRVWALTQLVFNPDAQLRNSRGQSMIPRTEIKIKPKKPVEDEPVFDIGSDSDAGIDQAPAQKSIERLFQVFIGTSENTSRFTYMQYIVDRYFGSESDRDQIKEIMEGLEVENPKVVGRFKSHEIDKGRGVDGRTRFWLKNLRAAIETRLVGEEFVFARRRGPSDDEGDYPGAVGPFAFISANPFVVTGVAALVEGTLVYAMGASWGWTSDAFMILMWMIIALHVGLGHLTWDDAAGRWKQESIWNARTNNRFFRTLIHSFTASGSGMLSLLAFAPSTWPDLAASLSDILPAEFAFLIPLITHPLFLAIVPHLIRNMVVTLKRVDSERYEWPAEIKVYDSNQIPGDLKSFLETYHNILNDAKTNGKTWGEILDQVSALAPRIRDRKFREGTASLLREFSRRFHGEEKKPFDIRSNPGVEQNLSEINEFLLPYGLMATVIALNGNEPRLMLRFSVVDRLMKWREEPANSQAIILSAYSPERFYPLGSRPAWKERWNVAVVATEEAREYARDNLLSMFGSKAQLRARYPRLGEDSRHLRRLITNDLVQGKVIGILGRHVLRHPNSWLDRTFPSIRESTLKDIDDAILRQLLIHEVAHLDQKRDPKRSAVDIENEALSTEFSEGPLPAWSLVLLLDQTIADMEDRIPAEDINGLALLDGLKRLSSDENFVGTLSRISRDQIIPFIRNQHRETFGKDPISAASVLDEAEVEEAPARRAASFFHDDLEYTHMNAGLESLWFVAPLMFIVVLVLPAQHLLISFFAAGAIVSVIFFRAHFAWDDLRRSAGKKVSERDQGGMATNLLRMHLAGLLGVLILSQYLSPESAWGWGLFTAVYSLLHMVEHYRISRAEVIKTVGDRLLLHFKKEMVLPSDIRKLMPGRMSYSGLTKEFIGYKRYMRAVGNLNLSENQIQKALQYALNEFEKSLEKPVIVRLLPPNHKDPAVFTSGFDTTVRIYKDDKRYEVRLDGDKVDVYEHYLTDSVKKNDIGEKWGERFYLSARKLETTVGEELDLGSDNLQYLKVLRGPQGYQITVANKNPFVPLIVRLNKPAGSEAIVLDDSIVSLDGKESAHAWTDITEHFTDSSRRPRVVAYDLKMSAANPHIVMGDSVPQESYHHLKMVDRGGVQFISYHESSEFSQELLEKLQHETQVKMHYDRIKGDATAMGDAYETMAGPMARMRNFRVKAEHFFTAELSELKGIIEFPFEGLFFIRSEGLDIGFMVEGSQWFAVVIKDDRVRGARQFSFGEEETFEIGSLNDGILKFHMGVDEKGRVSLRFIEPLPDAKLIFSPYESPLLRSFMMQKIKVQAAAEMTWPESVPAPKRMPEWLSKPLWESAVIAFSFFVILGLDSVLVAVGLVDYDLTRSVIVRIVRDFGPAIAVVWWQLHFLEPAPKRDPLMMGAGALGLHFLGLLGVHSSLWLFPHQPVLVLFFTFFIIYGLWHLAGHLLWNKFFPQWALRIGSSLPEDTLSYEAKFFRQALTGYMNELEELSSRDDRDGLMKLYERIFNHGLSSEGRTYIENMEVEGRAEIMTPMGPVSARDFNNEESVIRILAIYMLNHDPATFFEPQYERLNSLIQQLQERKRVSSFMSVPILFSLVLSPLNLPSDIWEKYASAISRIPGEWGRKSQQLRATLLSLHLSQIFTDFDDVDIETGLPAFEQVYKDAGGSSPDWTVVLSLLFLAGDAYAEGKGPQTSRLAREFWDGKFDPNRMNESRKRFLHSMALIRDGRWKINDNVISAVRRVIDDIERRHNVRGPFPVFFLWREFLWVTYGELTDQFSDWEGPSLDEILSNPLDHPELFDSLSLDRRVSSQGMLVELKSLLELLENGAPVVSGDADDENDNLDEGMKHAIMELSETRPLGVESFGKKPDVLMMPGKSPEHILAVSMKIMKAQTAEVNPQNVEIFIDSTKENRAVAAELNRYYRGQLTVRFIEEGLIDGKTIQSVSLSRKIGTGLQNVNLYLPQGWKLDDERVETYELENVLPIESRHLQLMDKVLRQILSAA